MFVTGKHHAIVQKKRPKPPTKLEPDVRSANKLCVHGLPASHPTWQCRWRTLSCNDNLRVQNSPTRFKVSFFSHELSLFRYGRPLCNNRQDACLVYIACYVRRLDNVFQQRTDCCVKGCETHREGFEKRGGGRKDDQKLNTVGLPRSSHCRCVTGFHLSQVNG